MTTSSSLSGDDIPQKVMGILKDTPYACLTLEKLSGGTANFVYRGELATLLEDGSKTVVVKHTESFIASNPGFKLTSTRCDYEQTILTALNNLSPTKHAGIAIQTPILYYFSPENNIQVYSDLLSATTLKEYSLVYALTHAQSMRIGKSLGIWAKGFHSWTAAAEQESLRETMKQNVAMRDLKFQINYGQLVAMTESFSKVLKDYKKTFEDIRNNMKKCLEKGEGVLIHGDFWTGNVLIPNIPLSEPPETTTAYIIDWELSHIAPLEYDLGQMFAEIFMLKYFKNIDAGGWLIESFMEGYGELDSEIAFKSAIQFGIHLVCWGPRIPGWGTAEQIEELVILGRDSILNGWAKNRIFFKNSPLESLFPPLSLN